MDSRLKLHLMAAPIHQKQAQATGLPLAWLCYRIGTGPRLLRSGTPVSLKGGIMVLSDEEYVHTGETSCSSFISQLTGEYVRRGFSGIVFDFERPSSLPLLLAIAPRIEKKGIPIFVPLPFRNVSEHCCALISSSVSGGSYQAMLMDAVEQLGANRVAIELRCMAQDFTLPFDSSDGIPLKQEALSQLLKDRSAYFNRELCAKYFTYLKENSPHFVLFDDAATMDARLQIAQDCGIRHAFALYPEISSFLDLLKHWK